MTHLYRADLHEHSYFSNKSPFCIVRKVNYPESYTRPRFIYDTAKAKGMDYVTITDHNTIDSAFVSVEIDTYFQKMNADAILLQTETEFLTYVRYSINEVMENIGQFKKRSISDLDTLFST